MRHSTIIVQFWQSNNFFQWKQSMTPTTDWHKLFFLYASKNFVLAVTRVKSHMRIMTKVKSHIILMLLFLPILITTKFHEWISISKNSQICNRNLNSKLLCVCVVLCHRYCIVFIINICNILVWWLQLLCVSLEVCYEEGKICVKPLGSLFWNTNWKRFVEAIFLLLRGEKTVKDGMYVLDQWSIPSPESMEVNQKSFHWLSWILEHVMCF